MRRRIITFLILAVFAVALAGCASGDQTLDAVDPQAVPDEPTYEAVFAIIQNKCNLCHDDGEGDDDDDDDYFVAGAAALADDDIPALNDCTSIVAQRLEILDQVENNTMPPGAMPRLTSEEKLKIRRWVENGAPAPCN
jgi:uncharacterized membrane protein